MNLLSLEQAQKSYGEKVLLKQDNFYLNEGEKVGIIGINGTGKTTLLRILAGTEVPDEGSRTGIATGSQLFGNGGTDTA